MCAIKPPSWAGFGLSPSHTGNRQKPKPDQESGFLFHGGLMASRRMIDPAFWQSENVARLELQARYFFIGLFSNADDQGRMKSHPALIRSQLFPYDDIPLDQIEAWLHLLHDGQFIFCYEVDGKGYLQIVNWWRYQRPSWAWPSDHPAPEGWMDRIKHRAGNEVVQSEGWDTDGGFGEVIVTSEWGQSEVTVSSAPSISNSISISDSNREETNEPATRAADAPLNLEGWLSLLEKPPEGSNRTAVLRNMTVTLFPGRDPPSYARIGASAKRASGAGDLARLLWQAAAQRPTGDPLDYVDVMITNRKKDRKNGAHQGDRKISIQGHTPTACTPEEFYGVGNVPGGDVPRV